MLALARAGLAAALVLLLSVPAIAADKPFKRADLPTPRSSSKRRSRPKPARSPRPPPRCAARPTPRSSATTSAAACSCSGRSWRSRPTTAPTGCGSAQAVLQIRPGNDRERAVLLERAATAAYIAYQRSTGNASEEADSLVIIAPHLCGPLGVAAGARCDAAVARPARGRRRARSNTSGCARTTASACSTTRSIRTRPRRAPASSSPRNCPASAPISRRSSRSPGIDKPALSVEEQAALRRRPQARRALQHHAARRHSVDGAGDAGEVGRVHRLCPRPQAVRALRRQGLRAAAHRPARHSGRQRQHHGGRILKSIASATAT